MRFFLFVAISSLATLCYAEPGYVDLSRVFPRDNSTNTIREYIETNFSSFVSTGNLFQFLDEEKKLDFIIPFIRVFKTYFPEKNYSLGYSGYWTNPIYHAIQNRNVELIRSIIDIDPRIVNMRNTGDQFSGADPISYAVRNNDIEIVRLLLPHIPNINAVVSHGDKERGEMDGNLLSLSTSTEMDNILIEKGISQYRRNYVSSARAFISEDRVNFRSEPNTRGPIIRQLNKDDEVKIVGYGFKMQNISGNNGTWIQVEFQTRTGWVFSPFLSIIIE